MMAAAKAHSGCGRKVRMSAIGKAALFLAITSSVVATAQAPQTSPAQKPSPAVSVSPAPTGQQRVPVSPYGHRAVTSQAQFRPNQPGTPQPAVRPVFSQAVATPPVQPRPVLPQPIQPPVPSPVAAQSPVQQAPVQQPIMQPVIAASSAASGAAAVDYSHGQLTVVSERATLGQVLKLVAAKTGGVVDVAPELQSEPVMARLGPGPVREVLTGLLDSPKVDYIIMAAGDGRNGLDRIVVRTRQSFGRTAMAAVRPAQPQQQLQEQASDETAAGPTPAEAKLTQEQLMQKWTKTREQMRLAEIQQQARERESEQTHAEAEPQTESQAEQPNGPPPPPDNPPQQ